MSENKISVHKNVSHYSSQYKRTESSSVLFLSFNGISTIVSNAKAIFIEDQQWYYLTHSWRYKGVHTFPKGINSKVNIITWLEFKFTLRPQSSTLAIILLGLTPKHLGLQQQMGQHKENGNMADKIDKATIKEKKMNTGW